MEPIVLNIQGQPPRKSNSRRIVTNRKTGKPMVVKSKEALAWMEAAAYQIPDEAKCNVGRPDQLLRIELFVRYETRRPDLSTELILDMLQKTGVIKDDRYIFEKVEHKIIDREAPGVDLVITAAEEHNLTPEQREVVVYELSRVGHVLVSIEGPFDDDSVLTHWGDGEWFCILPNGETTGYYYEKEGRDRDGSVSAPKVGEESSRAKLKEGDVLEIRRLCDVGEMSYREIADAFGVTEANIRKIGKRQSWCHVPER